MDLDSERDVITIKDLQLPYGIIAPNVWREAKAQPVLLSFELTLDPGIGSAADGDALDENTVHYGHLGKRIRNAYASDETLLDFISTVEKIVRDMGKRKDNTFRLRESKIQLAFPKASMNGDKVEIRRHAAYDADGDFPAMQTKIAICGMKVMTLIGVNANERGAKQPLMVDLELCVDSQVISTDLEAMASVFDIEHTLVEIIAQTSFETLESLAVHVLEQLRPVFVRMPFCSTVQLRIDKPRAILFADAPGIIVTRRLKPSNPSRLTDGGGEVADS